MKDQNKGTWRPVMLTLVILMVLIAGIIGVWYWRVGSKGPPSSSAKPVIYLYPEEETEVSVTLELEMCIRDRCGKRPGGGIRPASFQTGLRGAFV